MYEIPTWFFSLPGQGQATLVAAFIAGISGILGGLLREHLKLFIALAMGTFLVAVVAVALWAQKFDFATHTNYAMMFSRGIQLEDDKDRLVEECQRDVFFVGASMYVTLQARKDLIFERMQQGVHFRFLIADPDGTTLGANAAMFGQTPQQLQTEISNTISGFRDIASRWSAAQDSIAELKRGSISLRVADRVFATGFYFFDTSATPLDMLIVPHGMGKDAPELPAYKIPAHHPRVIKNYLSQHESVWATAKDVAAAP
jgi:hypothetical protein